MQDLRKVEILTGEVWKGRKDGRTSLIFQSSSFPIPQTKEQVLRKSYCR